MNVQSVAASVVGWRDVPLANGVRLYTALLRAIDRTFGSDFLERGRVNILARGELGAH